MKFVCSASLIAILSFGALPSAHAQTIIVDGAAISAKDQNLSPADAQAVMDPMSLIEAYLIDKKAPRNERGGWGKRQSNVYKAGEQIDAVVHLANVGKRSPGAADNAQDVEVFIRIRDQNGEIKIEARPVHTFKSTPKITNPLQDDYFSDRFTVSARVPDPGRYKVGFVFIDNIRSTEKQKEVETQLEVIVERADDAGELTDLVDLMTAKKADQSYMLRRCAAYFRSQIQLIGKKSFTEDQFKQIDSKVRYFLNADVLINTNLNGVEKEKASAETVNAMKEISFKYMTRMKKNYDGGDHPWAKDKMLQRDEAACTYLYNQRENK